MPLIDIAERRAPRCTLGGVVLEGQETYDWTLRSGTAPSAAVYTVSLACAEALTPLLGQPQNLVIEGPRKTLTYQQIYPLEFYPAGKFTRSLLLKDQRWKWPYAWLAPGWFNRRRETGERRLLNDQGVPENAVTEPRLLYEPTSLRPFGVTPGVTVWRARDILEHLLTAPEPDGLGVSSLELRITPSQAAREVEHLPVDDPGDVAIDRVLAYLSGVSLFQSRSGKIVVYNMFSDLGEGIARETRGERLATGPESLEVARAAVRPREIISLFSPDAELKLDFLEDETDSTTAVSSIDAPTLVNVARVVDVQTEVNGGMQARGSYARNTALFAAWGAFGLLSERVTVSLLRRSIFSLGGARFEAKFSVDTEAFPQPLFAARAHEARETFRRLYRVAPTFYGRLESMAPVRAAIINQETGTRAPSPVYSSYLRRPAIRPLVKTSPTAPLGWAISGYAGGAITSSSHVAPVRVHVADAGVGVIQLMPLLETTSGFDEIALGFPEGEAVVPGVDGLGQANKTRDAARAQWASVVLASGYRMATIVSVTPATPANHQRFYQLRTPVPGGTGPPLYSRIFPGVVTARFAWDDSKSDQIIGAIRGEGDWQSLSDLLVNQVHLEAVHAANVQRILFQFRDRTYGGHDVDMDPELEPQGSLGEVRHIMARGATVTQLRWPADARPADIWRFMDAGTRQALLRIMVARPQAGTT